VPVTRPRWYFFKDVDSLACGFLRPEGWYDNDNEEQQPIVNPRQLDFLNQIEAAI